MKKSQKAKRASKVVVLCDICKATTHTTQAHYADIMYNREMTRK